MSLYIFVSFFDYFEVMAVFPAIESCSFYSLTIHNCRTARGCFHLSLLYEDYRMQKCLSRPFTNAKKQARQNEQTWKNVALTWSKDELFRIASGALHYSLLNISYSLLNISSSLLNIIIIMLVTR